MYKTQTRNREFVSGYLSGKSVAYMAKENGVSAVRVYQIIRKQIRKLVVLNKITYEELGIHRLPVKVRDLYEARNILIPVWEKHCNDANRDKQTDSHH